MGFYGNITNQASTQFKFDKTYPNRAEMDGSANTDGIYVGRYVLVEYGDGTLKQSDLTRGYLQKIDANNNAFLFTSPGYEPATRLYVKGDTSVTTGRECPAGTVVYVLPEDSGDIQSYKYIPFDDLKKELTPGSTDAYNLTDNYYAITKSVKQNKSLWTRVNSYANTSENETKNNNIITKIKKDIRGSGQAYYAWDNDNGLMMIVEDLADLTIEGLTNADKGYWTLTNTNSYVIVSSGAAYSYENEYLSAVRDTLFNTTVYFMAMDELDHRFVQTEFPFYENDGSVISKYTFNYNIDISSYGAGRGYDSTVWQKVFENNVIKYVMIAELNSVVPTFDISADVPSMSPVIPHFDKDSTNVYYKVHWQPQWGMRIKGSKAYTVKQLDNAGNEIQSLDTISSSTDTTTYPSDLNTQWVKFEYDPSTGEENSFTFNPTTQTWDLYEDNNPILHDLGAAIYFNKAGLDSHYITDSTYNSGSDLTDESAVKKLDANDSSSILAKNAGKIDNAIKITPSGQSGHRYNTHSLVTDGNGNVTGYPDKAVGEDIQEISVMLPGIGDAISQMWDIVYGDRNQNSTVNPGSYEVTASRIRNQDIQWDSTNGLRLVRSKAERDGGNGFTYEPSQVNTLAGCINSVHDLMGMIIVDYDLSGNPLTDSVLADKIKNADPNKIYYYKTKDIHNNDVYGYHVRHKTHNYDPITQYIFEQKDVLEDHFTKYSYYIKAPNGYDITGKTINHDYFLDTTNEIYLPTTTFDSTAVYYIRRLQQEYEPIELYEYAPNDIFYSYDEPSQSYNVATTYEYEPNKKYLVLQKKDDDGVIPAGNVWMKTQELNQNYEANKYYYLNNNMYELSTDTTSTPGRIYFVIEDTNKTEEIAYNNDTEFYYKKDKYYYIASSTVADTTAATYVKNAYFTRVEISEGVFTYTRDGDNFDPNKIYYEVAWAKDSSEIKTDGRQYFDVVLEKAQSYDSQGNPMGIVDIVVDCSPIITMYQYPEDADNNYYYYDTFNHRWIPAPKKVDYNGNYDAWMTEVFTHSSYYSLNPDKIENFYTPNRFYYEDANHNFLLDSAMERDTTKIYYLPRYSNIEDGITFYQPGVFYYENGDHVKERDDNPTLTTNRIYFKIFDNYYVSSDAKDLMNVGALWNAGCISIPSTIVLGKREDYYIMQDLDGFARTLNTINGLIVSINQKLSTNDEKTRDPQTVQGAINLLNDIINKFDSLECKDILIVDQYGRITGSDQTTAQPFSYENFGDDDAVPAIRTDEEDQWIYLNVNDTADDGTNHPMITVHHRLVNEDVPSSVKHKVTDTTTGADLNNISATNTSYTAGKGNNQGKHDALDLYTPIVDNAGHVVGHNTETVELPYGFKTISVANSTVTTKNTQGHFDLSGTIDDNENVASIVADNTQADVNINAGNRWIRLKTDANGQDNNRDNGKPNSASTLTVLHETHDFDTVEVTETNLNAEANSTLEHNINIPDWTYDLAGHITGKKDHKYTLPYGFKTITTNGRATEVSENATGTPSIGKVVADSTQDSLAINSGNKWIRIDTKATNDDGAINNDVVTIRHDVHNFASGAANTLYGLAANETITTLDVDNTFEVPNFKFDEAGHITAAETHTVALPENFTNISIGNVSNATGQITPTAGTIQADTLTDTVTINPGNRWVVLAADATNDAISISHAAPGTASTTGDNNKVPCIAYDQTGHINTVTEKHIGLFKLDEYVAAPSEVVLANDITAGDTLHAALAKIQYQLNLLDNATHYRGSLTKGAGQTEADVLATVVNPADGDIVYVGVKEYIYCDGTWHEMGDETIYVTKAFATVATVSPLASETIANISQTDGKIAVTKQAIQIAQSQVDSLPTDLTTIRTNIANENTRATGVEGTLANLTTDEKSNLVAAINEVDRHIDDAANIYEPKITDNVTKATVFEYSAAVDKSAEIAVLNNQITTLEAQRDALDPSAVDYAEQALEIDEQINSLQQQITALRAQEHAAINYTLEQLIAHINTLEARIIALENN